MILILSYLCLFRASTHEDCPENDDYIRVKDYASQMVVKPHRTFNEVNTVNARVAVNPC